MPERATKPLGFQTGECWGGILEHPPTTPAAQAAKYLYQNGGRNGRPMVARLMVKFEEIETAPDRHARAASRVSRATEYGCPVMLCVDWHNICDAKATYHKYQYWPTRQSVAKHVRDLLREFRPYALEVANEYYYLKGTQDMRVKDYTKRVMEYVEGAEMANWDGLLVASNKHDEGRDRPQDLWMWHVPWTNCAESFHRLILSGGPSTAEALERELDSYAYVERGKAIGWQWPLYITETSPVNNTADINTDEGAKMMMTMLEHHDRFNLPLVMLAMAGDQYAEDYERGAWGMKTWFVDKRGDLSFGAQAWLDYVGAAQPPEFDEEDDVDETPDEGGLTRAEKADRIRRNVRRDLREMKYQQLRKLRKYQKELMGK